jgi:hypothetical protein
LNNENENNTGFRDLYNRSLTAGIPMIIYLHAEKSEMKTGEYNIHKSFWPAQNGRNYQALSKKQD